MVISSIPWMALLSYFWRLSLVSLVHPAYAELSLLPHVSGPSTKVPENKKQAKVINYHNNKKIS